jgi:arylsulfatase A-like enzyme
MILDFVTRLKILGRFDSSIIIISSDHGGGYEVVDNELVNIGHKGPFSPEWSKARSRALLLVKARGNRNPINTFKVSYAETTLIDIAPTILECAGISTNLNFEGVSILGHESALVGRRRYYHFYKKKANRGWTDEMTRFIIEGNEIRKDKIIELTNNPQKLGGK